MSILIVISLWGCFCSSILSFFLHPLVSSTFFYFLFSFIGRCLVNDERGGEGRERGRNGKVADSNRMISLQSGEKRTLDAHKFN